jgi:hypothetical protein
MIMKVHAFVAASGALPHPAWQGVLPEELTRAPIFTAADFQLLPAELLDFVRVCCPGIKSRSESVFEESDEKVQARSGYLAGSAD